MSKAYTKLILGIPIVAQKEIVAKAVAEKKEIMYVH